MKDYHQYLHKQGYATSTINTYTRETSNFIQWCKRRATAPESIDYKTCLQYIKYLQRKKVSKRTVSLQLGCIKKYLDYLVTHHYRISNPIEDTIIKGVKRVINYTLLTPDELEDLYYSYQTDTYLEEYHKYTAKRDKMIIGLLVYQGLATKDFTTLKLEHLQIHKGKLYIPSSKKSNARELELKPWQIMECMEYVNEVRDILIQRLKNYTHTEQLFPSGDRFIIMDAVIKKIRKYNQKVKNAKQIRASVITNWLQQHNLRKVQYMAGHRYISSTERYLTDDLENLHEIVNNFHPIR
ncbi:MULTISPECIES: tyrosine-type recombinase/integrase [unclassified Aquimarina]|uniref:tyrosine-type recombinase/integrase n=1 Tax=unclassified Aquimarina TaxID=2627091 RepID=UPI0018C99D73|nr:MULTISPECIES: tyrosine-type recombinase/integrase [unclassified Aquimarina]MBG6130725.1 integrase/recombinase XerD [Aquimarina sp. EL_35]MBG6151129.1 integrase/recombinase XerD [Aquimarina sp. EL_32]